MKKFGIALTTVAMMTATGAWAAKQETVPVPDRSGVRSTTDGIIDTPIEEHRRHEAQDRAGGLHIPGSVSNVTLIGKLDLPRTNSRPGIVTDVWSKGNFAYFGTFDVVCGAMGVNVVDISDPTNPQKVRFLPSRPGTRTNDVKVFSFSNLDSGFSGDLLMHSNEICKEGPQAVGGISIWDVTAIPKAELLASGVGDNVDNSDGSTLPRARQVHNVYAWQDGSRAYAALVDDEELLDVDILDITDPRNPVLIAETGGPDWPQMNVDAWGSDAFLHDVWAKKIDGKWKLLLSYWDGGFVVLDVSNPHNPVFEGDSDYPNPDPLILERLGEALQAEGNAHAAVWSADGRFVLAGDEEGPLRSDFRVTTAGHPAEGEWGAGEFGWTVPVFDRPDGTLNGPTVFGGYGCPDDRGSVPRADVAIPDSDLLPSEERIVVFQRGPVQDPNHDHSACFFSEKIESGQLAGYDAVIIANHHNGAGGGAQPDAFFCGGQGHQFDITTHGLCTGHRLMHMLFGTTPDFTVPYPVPPVDEPVIGTRGPRIFALSKFDGSGPLHLINAETLEEIDAWAPVEVHDPTLVNFGDDLTMHNVETDPVANIAYISWYKLGLQIVGFDDTGLTPLGHYIDANGNNLWGVHVATDHPTENGLILASDRDSGLWIFRYTPGTP